MNFEGGFNRKGRGFTAGRPGEAGEARSFRNVMGDPAEPLFPMTVLLAAADHPVPQRDQLQDHPSGRALRVCPAFIPAYIFPGDPQDLRKPGLRETETLPDRSYKGRGLQSLLEKIDVRFRSHGALR